MCMALCGRQCMICVAPVDGRHAGGDGTRGGVRGRGRAANAALEADPPEGRGRPLRHTADVRYDDPAIRRVLRAIPWAEGEPSALPSGTHSPSAGGSPLAEWRTWPSRAIPPRAEGDPSVRRLTYDTMTRRSGECRPRQAAPSPLSRQKPAGRAANVALTPASRHPTRHRPARPDASARHDTVTHSIWGSFTRCATLGVAHPGIAPSLAPVWGNSELPPRTLRSLRREPQSSTALRILFKPTSERV